MRTRRRRKTAQSGKEYQKKYYLKNKKRIADRDRAKRLELRKNKLCPICNSPCLNLSLKKYCSFDCYEKGKVEYNTKWKRDSYYNGWFHLYKKSLGGCVRCGYNKSLAALDFHHIDPKSKSKSPTSVKNCSEEVGMVELKKCELICANCHREETWGDYYATRTQNGDSN